MTAAPAQTTMSRSSVFRRGWPRSRAWVRKPVCATIRWSGRTDWPSMCQPRWSTSIVSAIPKSDSASVSRSWAAWVIWGV